MMTTTTYVLRTWLLAQGLHPVIFFCEGLLLEGSWMYFDIAVLIFMCGLFFSLPALGCSVLTLKWIRLLSVSDRIKFLLWFVAIALCLLIGNWIVGLVFFGEGLPLELMWISAPGFVAAVIASFLFHKQFFQAIQIITYEDDLRSESE